MPNYEHFKKYDEWSKQKPAQPPADRPQDKSESGLARILKSLKGAKKG